MATSYLIEHCDRSLDAALKEFASASPPGIYSRHYLEVRVAFGICECPHVRLTIDLIRCSDSTESISVR